MEVSVIYSDESLHRKPIGDIDFTHARIVTMLDPDEELLILLKQIGLDINEIDFNGLYCCVLSRGLMFHNPPRRSLSKGSDAIYLAESNVPEDNILLQYLRPNSKTSRHYHKRRTEIYYSLEGSGTIETGTPNVIVRGSSFAVEPEITHQVKTGEKASLMVIVGKGGSSGLTLEDHYYVE